MLSKCIYNDRYSNTRLRFPGTTVALHLTKIIGSGGYSDVYATTQKEFVVKVCPLDSTSDAEMLMREVHLEQKCASPHVLKLESSVFTKWVGFILLERAAPVYPEDERSPELFKTLALALQCLHRQGIAHRDIKMENMLKCGETFKLADFGSASTSVIEFTQLLDGNFRTKVQSDIQEHTTPQFRAPEQIELLRDNGPIGTAVDVFAYGVFLFKALSGEYPFDTEFASFQCNPNLSLIKNDLYRRIIHRCLVRRVCERASMDEVVCLLEATK